MQYPGTGIAEVIPGQAGNTLQSDNEEPACTLLSCFLESLHFGNTDLLQGATYSWVKIPVNCNTMSCSFFPLYLEQNGLPFKEIEFSCGFAYINTTLTHSPKF